MINELGQPLTAEQVKTILGIGINQVYRHAQEIGGVRIGKKWVFFESNVLAALRKTHADQQIKQEDREIGVVRESNVPRAIVHEKAPIKAGCAKMGAANKEGARKPAVNRHGLFEHAV